MTVNALWNGIDVMTVNALWNGIDVSASWILVTNFDIMFA